MNMQALTIRDLSVVAGEPRVHDLEIAKRLGFERPRDIRKLIDRNMGELQRYGQLVPMAEYRATAGRNPGIPRHGGAVIEKQGRGQPVKGWLLNEGQTLLISAKADTPAAADVRYQMISVCMAYRAGALKKVAQPRRAGPDRPLPEHASSHPGWRDPLAPVLERQNMLAAVAERVKQLGSEELVNVLPYGLRATGQRIVNPRFFRDKEVPEAVIRTHRQATIDQVQEWLAEKFGPIRAPSRSSLHRFWKQLDGLYGARRRLH